MQNYLPILIGLALAVLAAKSDAQTRTAYEVAFEPNVEMKTRDGVSLRADIYRLKAGGKFPVLINRTPYDKRHPLYIPDGIASAQRGYVFITQDARGRFDSQGEWYPFKYEAEDGYDTVEWAAALPYSNGKVAMTGISYVGVPQLLTAVAAPPHLVAIYPGITGSNYHANWIYQGGAFSQLFSQEWAAGFVIADLARQLKTAIPFLDSKRPPIEYPLLNIGSTKDFGRYYYDWLAHPRYDEYWKQWSVEEHYNEIKVPALHVGAWYDLFMPGALRNYQGIKEHGGSAVARSGQHLVVFPGGHAGWSSSKVGEVDFGKGAIFDFTEYGLRWFDWVVKGIDNGMAREKPVRLFVMGKNIWREEDSWPLARPKNARYYLHSQGHANTLSGNGSLGMKVAAAEKPDTYIYDPDDPVPTHGGAIGGGPGAAGPRDQRALESRPDVLVYTSPAFDQDTEVTGPVSLELFVSSSAVDTDFTAKLVDVWPNGFAQNLCDGILRVRYRNSTQRAELMKLGQIYKLTIALSATSNVFRVGHMLRVHITSSDFPRFDRNLNTAEDPESATSSVKATNIIYHDQNHPSAVIVPIIP
jgi:putative CocE/NonD family hydrolase